LRELERRRLILQFQQQDAEQELSRQEPNQMAGKKVDLKKQSQSVPAMMGVTPLMKGDYDNISTSGIEENKANPPGLSMSTRN
jgi:hypothetical protein